jgi:hypothetical protein
MSAADQAVVSAICQAEVHTSIAEEKAHRTLLLGDRKPSADEKEARRALDSAIARVADAVVAHLAATDTQTQRINESYLALRRLLGIRTIVQTA